MALQYRQVFEESLRSTQQLDRNLARASHRIEHRHGPRTLVRFVVERIPVPDVSDGNRPEVTKIVDGMPTLEADRADADTSELEDAIDGLAYDLCGVTKSQVEVVVRAMQR